MIANSIEKRSGKTLVFKNTANNLAKKNNVAIQYIQ